MAIVTPEIWAAFAGKTLTNPSGEYTSIEVICNQVDRGIKSKLKRTLERQTFTGLILDAPNTPNILLQKYAPIVIDGFECRYNPQAQGDPTLFDDSLLTMYQDYRLDTDEDDNSLSPGNLQYLRGIWGINYRYRPWELAPSFTSVPGALKLTFNAGYEIIPDDIVMAACIAVSQTNALKDHGFVKGSESWNGYSMNLPGVGLMVHGVLGNPDISSLLLPYMNYGAMIG